jgi:TonB-dependent starch-binding outer membrane protein SusC
MKKNVWNAKGVFPSWLSSKTFLIMRNVLVIIFISVFQVYATESLSQDNRITLNMGQETLKTVLRAIEQGTDYTFLYNSRLVDDTRKVDAFFNDNEIEEVLPALFNGTDVMYQVIDRQIILSTRDTLSGIQPGQITGTVLDENGNPLPGVTIHFKGTSAGTVTDVNGRYTIDRPEEARIIVFSSVGYGTQEIEIGDRTVINVQMKEDVHGLEEVVVIGYGSQVKKNLSSSVSSVNPETIASSPVSSFEGGLQGRAAGVQVTTSSALGGSAVRIRVRGTSSASANSEPLYVIDGVPMESGEISTSQPGAGIGEWNLQTAANTNVLASLNPSDIESIEILKDASAAAIYGSRGANGVVLITTKQGRKGKTQINVTSTFGVSEPTRRIPLLNSTQYIGLAQEAWTNMYKQGEQLVTEGEDFLGNWYMDRYDTINNFAKWWQNSGVLVDGLTKEEALETNTDWIDAVLRTGTLQEYNISANGGSEKTSFFISANLKDESTILSGNDYQRFGARINLEHQLTKRIKAGAKMSLTHINDQQVPTSWAGGVGSVNTMLPIWPVYKEDGSYFNLSDQHPVAGVDLRTLHLSSNQVLGNWFVSLNILEGLTFRSEVGTNLIFMDDFHFRDGRITSHGRSVSSTVLGNRSSFNWKNVLNYKKSIKQHNFDVLAATDIQSFRSRINTVFGDTYFNSALQKPTDAAVVNASYFETGYSFASYIGRLNYNYKSRYLLSASLRADGSSRFAPNNRWGFFPAASVGYTVSEEPYFSSLIGTINFLKLRASYGIVGNAEIGDYSYVSSYSTLSYNSNTGITLSNLGDDQLTWESTRQLDIGLTWENFDGRISGEFDYYYKLTSDLLLPYPVSGMTGVSTVTRNIGEISNRGMELMLNTVNVSYRDFSWETNFTIAHNENQVVSLAENVGEGFSQYQLLGGFALFIGKPVGVIEVVEWGGVDSETGEDTYIDTEGNVLLYSEVLDQYDNIGNFWTEHKKPMGNPWPKFAGGLDNRFSWKQWYANIMITYATGMDFFLGEQKTILAAFGSTKINPTEFLYNRWQEPGDDASVSKLTVENISWTTTSEHLHRTDYVRLKDITIGRRFAFPGSDWIAGLNVYLKATNLFTLTKAPDFFWDPEYSGVVQSRTANNLNAGESYKAAPQARFLMAGLSFDF